MVVVGALSDRHPFDEEVWDCARKGPGASAHRLRSLRRPFWGKVKVSLNLSQLDALYSSKPPPPRRCLRVPSARDQKASPEAARLLRKATAMAVAAAHTEAMHTITK